MKTYHNRRERALLISITGFIIIVCIAPELIFLTVQIPEAEASESETHSAKASSTDKKIIFSHDGKRYSELDLPVLLTRCSYRKVIDHPDRVETTLLKKTTAKESYPYTLIDPKRIVGFPIAKAIRTIDSGAGKQVGKLIVNAEHYVPLRWQGIVDTIYGIRFTKGQQVIEFAIGYPGQRFLAVFEDEDGLMWWGGYLRGDVMYDIISILGFEVPEPVKKKATSRSGN